MLLTRSLTLTTLTVVMFVAACQGRTVEGEALLEDTASTATIALNEDENSDSPSAAEDSQNVGSPDVEADESLPDSKEDIGEGSNEDVQDSQDPNGSPDDEASQDSQASEDVQSDLGSGDETEDKSDTKTEDTKTEDTKLDDGTCLGLEFVDCLQSFNCTWENEACREAEVNEEECEAVTQEFFCDQTFGCEWDTGKCVVDDDAPEGCEDIEEQFDCLLESACTWANDKCLDIGELACDGYETDLECRFAGCEWDVDKDACDVFDCSEIVDEFFCLVINGCEWDSDACVTD